MSKNKSNFHSFQFFVYQNLRFLKVHESFTTRKCDAMYMLFKVKL
jgi:hypothetical protein